MIITDIIELDKKRDKVYIDDEFAFVLYKGEQHLYGIEVGMSLPSNTYTTIVDEVLLKRAKLRAMNLLTKKDYTEKQLRRKLSDGYYNNEQIEKTIQYLKEYGYIDDIRYVKNYFSTYIQTKPRNKIVQKLLEKGISEEIIDALTDAIYEEEAELTEVPNEMELGKRLLDKKKYDINGSMKEKQKAYGYLLRKGISADVAIKLLKEYQKD